MKPEAKPVRKPARRRKPAAVQDTFTVRDMNRRPQVVLNAARKLGRITIRSRGNGNFVMQVEPQAVNKRVGEALDFIDRLETLHRRFREAGFTGLSKPDSEKLARMIAGEEP